MSQQYNQAYLNLIVFLAKIKLIKVKHGQVSHALTMIFGHGPQMPPCSLALPMVDTSLHYVQILSMDEDV